MIRLWLFASVFTPLFDTLALIFSPHSRKRYVLEQNYIATVLPRLTDEQLKKEI